MSALCDMKAVYGVPGPSQAALEGLLAAVQPVAPPPVEGVEPTPLDFGPAVRVFGTILKIRKASRPEVDLTLLLERFQAVVALFPPDAQIDGVDAMWESAHAGEPFARTWAELSNILAALDQDRRLAGARAYGVLLEQQGMAAAEAYDHAMDARQAEIRARERAAADARERKGEARKLAFAGILGSLALVAVVGLFLGLLAVERNTRALSVLVDRLGPVSEAQAPPVG